MDVRTETVGPTATAGYPVLAPLHLVALVVLEVGAGLAPSRYGVRFDGLHGCPSHGVRGTRARAAGGRRLPASTTLLRRNSKQAARIGVRDHPYGAVRSDRHVANTLADSPAFGWRGSALFIERDAIQRKRCHASHQG